MNREKILILGVTASGKSRLAFDLAKDMETEVISIDSMKVYKKMDIGTAKPSLENRKIVNYHLLDVVEPWESFGVNKFLELEGKAEKDILSRRKCLIAAGGTSMYIKNLLYGLFEGPGTDEAIREKLKKQLETEGQMLMHQRLAKVDPEAAERIHPNDAKRLVRALEVYEITGKPISSFQTQFNSSPDPSWFVIGIRRPKEVESKRINARVKKMVEMGLVEEAKELFNMERPLSKQASVAIGYTEFFDYFKGKITLEKAIEQVKINTRRLAKGQRTWFKSFEGVNWIDADEDTDPKDVLRRAKELINS
ncbi:MAG: tRNA (adenosine(37)-N6)-dimethylallyltransferase MiaA [Sedimentisphaeraceae bacterium JB056]